ncbi:acetylornithine deacetylase/succinyl-diaminopimelate desuccinylase [Halococcus morrhuae DSM 1307]|uniref:Acetylornithine deacetylase/succinyl-diaminopimelate desuccinylase n=1 Tax=Halococcus morrhuae DSM 1307 TaxID=931277 RepID=M0MQ49_HALMO|nr:M20/M25/M40 family metallo-hydrolase [Halococcus morrhuae]EMA46869.1 acetylornithine deacetylase/succinyl-diaminopimelate desuccinylase [Halococcus morrhuae DSM 1307]
MTTRHPTEYVSAHRKELIDLVLDLLDVDTSNPPGETRALVDALEERLAPLSVDVDRIAIDPVKPNLLVTVPGESDRTLLYDGHLDTVPFDEDEWSYDPLGEQVDERIYGRGATDMKSAIAAMLFTIQAYAKTDTTPPVDLVFAFVSDEEVGGDAGLPTLLSDDRLDADACVIGEPTCKENRYSVTVADRGSIWLTLDAAGEAAHGSRPVLGENAIDRLYAAVQTLRDRFGARELDIDTAIRPIVEESIDYYAPLLGEESARTLFRYPSINLGTIQGGETINSVPQSAQAEIDIRLTAGVQTPDVLGDIRDCVADCDGITIADVSWSIGTAETPDSPLVEAVTSAAESVTNTRVYRRSGTGGGDAKKLRNTGIPTVEFALGTDTVHAIDEYTTVESLLGNALVYTRLPSAWPE